MSVGFGFSIGDLITSLKIIKDSIEAVKDTKGASADYAALSTEIASLQDAFEAIEDLPLARNGSEKQRIAISRAVGACQQCIDDFSSSISKYQPHLNPLATGLASSYRKIKWALCRKEDVAMFRTKLERHTSSINMLLITMQAKELHTANDRACSSVTVARAQDRDRDGQILGLLKGLSIEQRQWCEILMLQNRELRRDIQDLHQLLEVHMAIPPQVLLRPPVILLDAFGRVAPFHLDFIDSLETFTAVLKIRFRQAGVKPAGLAKLDNREFCVQESRRKVHLDLAKPWPSVFRPGQEVDMSMVFHRFGCSPSTCPGCSKKNEDDDDHVQWYVLSPALSLENGKVASFMFTLTGVPLVSEVILQRPPAHLNGDTSAVLVFLLSG